MFDIWKMTKLMLQLSKNVPKFWITSVDSKPPVIKLTKIKLVTLFKNATSFKRRE